MNIIASDIGSEVSTTYAIRNTGKVIFAGMVGTDIPSLREVVKRVPRPRQLVFEEGCQSVWLWSELEPLCDDILICDPRKNGKIGGEKKTDCMDVQKLAEYAQKGWLHRVWHGGGVELQSLRHAVYLYRELTEQSTRLKNQIKWVFRSRGIRGAKGAYETAGRAKLLLKLPTKALKNRVARLGSIMDLVTLERRAALQEMVALARKSPMYKPLRAVDGIGPIFAAIFIAAIGCPERFRTRRQFWAYGGLSIRTDDSSEYEVRADGRIERKRQHQRTRGLTRHFNPMLKYALKQIAMTLSRTKWKLYYDKLLTRSKNANNAQLTLARKVATVVLHIAKTGERYEIEKVFGKQ